MSMPKIPDLNPDINIKREDAINIIIASIAMEELALAHILNAEGEKLQYILGTLDDKDPGEITICDIMAVNKSIQKTLRDVIKTEILLQFKLEDALEMAEDGEQCQLTITGRKIWIDDKAESRPENVEISLLRNGVTVDTRTVSSKGDGSFSFACLPVLDSSRQKYTYTVDETVVPAGYKKTVNGFTVINTSLLTTINGTKTWVDGGAATRPVDITINLLQNGAPFKSQTITNDIATFSFADVPRFDNDGTPFVYTIEGDDIADYDKKIDGFNISNTYNP